MAIKALNFTKTVCFESDEDPDKGTDKATRFILGAVPARVIAAINDRATTVKFDAKTNEASTITDANMTHLELVKFGLKGIENFTGEDGKEIRFRTKSIDFFGKKYEVADDALIDLIGFDVVVELATAIRNFNTLEEDTRKKSGK